jgi:hypothetical protein
LENASLQQLKSLPDNFWETANEPVPANLAGGRDGIRRLTVNNIMARISFYRSPETTKIWAEELRRIGLEVPEE